MSLRYGTLGADPDSAFIVEILSRCFAFPPGDALPWIDRAGRQHLRVLHAEGRPVACLLMIPMGQYFGGRSVPTIGVAAVGVAPELRGRGFAARIMADMLREVRDSGGPLSTLYPATQVLYRKVGYEQAGGRFETTVSCDALRLAADLGGDASAEGELDLRPTSDGDLERVTTAYRLGASRAAGQLDRGPYVWDRVRSPRGQTAFGYVAASRDKVEGYTYFFQRQVEGGRYALRLTDLCANTPRAARRLLRLLSEHRSMATTVTWYGGPSDPCVALLAEQAYATRLDHHWMLRVVDVKKALSARGYPKGLEAELHLEIADDLLAENAGRFVLTVGGGRGRVRAGGKGRLALHVRALAALYSGHLSAAGLRSIGMLRGDDRAVTEASAVFAGPVPAMPDMF